MRDETRRDLTEVSPDEFDDAADTRVQAAATDDIEDTFRTGPSGDIPLAGRAEADTEETFAADEEDLLEAPPTEVSQAVPYGVAAERAKRSRPVVEVRRTPPAAPGRATASKQKLRMPSIREPAPRRTEAPAQDRFAADDAPAIGVDPALFPIHQTPPRRVGPGLLLGAPVVLVLVVLVAFFSTDDGDSEDATLAARRQAIEAASRARARATLAAAAAVRKRSAAELEQSASRRPMDRASRIRRARQPVVRRRFSPPVRTKNPIAPPILQGGVKRKYGDREEHVAPEAGGSFLIVLSEPTAMVFDGDRLLGATPLMTRVEPDTRSKRVTLKRFGHVEKTVEAEAGPDGNLEISVLLEPDPKYAGFKTPKPPPEERRPVQPTPGG